MTAKIIELPQRDDGTIPVVCGLPLIDADPAMIARHLGAEPVGGENFILHTTASPYDEHDQEVTRRELDELTPRRVVAVLQPHAPGFAQLVRQRFAADGGYHG